ncbi:MAG: hypothetical protein WCI72_06030 [archaeon]
MEVLAREDMQQAYKLLNEEIDKDPGKMTIDINPYKVLTIDYFIQDLQMELESPLDKVDVFFQKVGSIYNASAYVSTLVRGMFSDCSDNYMRTLAMEGLRFRPLNHQVVGNIFEKNNDEPIFTIQAAKNDCMRKIIPNYRSPNSKPVTNKESFYTLLEKLNVVTSGLISVTAEKRKDTPKLRKHEGIFVYYPETSTLVDTRGKSYHN